VGFAAKTETLLYRVGVGAGRHLDGRRHPSAKERTGAASKLICQRGALLNIIPCTRSDNSTLTDRKINLARPKSLLDKKGNLSIETRISEYFWGGLSVGSYIPQGSCHPPPGSCRGGGGELSWATEVVR